MNKAGALVLASKPAPRDCGLFLLVLQLALVFERVFELFGLGSHHALNVALIRVSLAVVLVIGLSFVELHEHGSFVLHLGRLLV